MSGNTLTARNLDNMRDNTSHNPQRSAFLSRLPAEIRNLIYEYVLTAHNIHIDCRSLISAVVHPSERLNKYVINGRPWGISATVCLATTTDTDAYAQTTLDKREDSSVAYYEDRHAACVRPSRTSQRHRLPIALLKTCRQIHSEALGFLYADNTFSFKTPEDMDLFITIALNAQQRLWIRSMRLHCETTRYRDPFITLGEDMPVTTLENLRFFGLNIADYYKPYGVPELPKIPTKKLKRVEVIVGPKPSHARGAKDHAHRNRHHAEEFEKRLLAA